MIYFSASTRGFYHSDIFRGVLPSDAKEITDQQWREAIQAQDNGLEISADESGFPIAVARKFEPISPSQQILMLEASVTPRRMREAVLTDAGRAWLENVETSISELRKQLK